MNIIKSLLKTISHATSGQLKKIENTIQLKNAIEILESKNEEMKNKYFNLMAGLKGTQFQITRMDNSRTSLKSRDTEISSAKIKIYDEGIESLTKAKEKLESVRKTMKENIRNHRTQIELLKTKLTYLESLKTVNSYLKDVSDDYITDNGIMSIVDNAIMSEEAVSEALSDMKDIDL